MTSEWAREWTSDAEVEKWAGKVRVGLIGGSGLYKLEGLHNVAEVNPKTPWGYPSSPITIAKTASGVHVAFLARHGRSHQFTPSQVPSLANLSALKHLGARAVLAFSAVGSLREEIAPRDFVVPSQLVDRTKGVRRASFFGEGDQVGVVAHAPFGDPFDETLRPVVEKIIRETLAKEAPKAKVHGDRTCVVMEGPAFSTRAESNLYRSWGGDIINMSALPEAKLAREAELAYVLIATATDYDAWRASESGVDVAEVLATLQSNVATSQKVTAALLEPVHALVSDDDDDAKAADGAEAAAREALRRNVGVMKGGIMTKPEATPTKAKESLAYLFEWFGK